MKFLGNIIWLICGGLLTAVEYLYPACCCDYDNRYPFRVADIEIRNAGPLALRQPGDRTTVIQVVACAWS